MRLSTRYGLTGIGALSLLTTAHQLRGIERSSQPAIDYLLGVLPNFAAAIAITFVPLTIWAEQNRDADLSTAKRPFSLCASISGVSLLAWEVLQRLSKRLVFDPYDVAATLVGLAAACLIFYALSAQLRPPA
jgi:hypothetical protein